MAAKATWATLTPEVVGEIRQREVRTRAPARRGRKKARRPSASSSGSSIAVKWPPPGISVQRWRLKERSPPRNGPLRICPSHSPSDYITRSRAWTKKGKGTLVTAAQKGRPNAAIRVVHVSHERLPGRAMAFEICSQGPHPDAFRPKDRLELVCHVPYDIMVIHGLGHIRPDPIMPRPLIPIILAIRTTILPRGSSPRERAADSRRSAGTRDSR
jgi:hypothetical protein